MKSFKPLLMLVGRLARHLPLLGLVILAGLVASCCKEDIPDYSPSPRMNVSDSLALEKVIRALYQWPDHIVPHKYGLWARFLKKELDKEKNEYRIVGIDCYGCTGVLTPEVLKLERLRSLSVSGVNFKVEIPTEIDKLSELNGIELEGGQLKGELPKSLRSLNALKYLRFSRMKASFELPSWLYECSNLTYLDLSFNQLYGTLPPEWGLLSKLEILKLDSNQIEGELPREWGMLSQIRTMELQNNQLRGDVKLEVLGRATYVNLGNNHFTTLPFAIWDDKSSTPIPDMRGNRLSGNVPNWVIKTRKWQTNKFWISNQQEGYGYIF